MGVKDCISGVVATLQPEDFLRDRRPILSNYSHESAFVKCNSSKLMLLKQFNQNRERVDRAGDIAYTSAKTKKAKMNQEIRASQVPDRGGYSQFVNAVRCS